MSGDIFIVVMDSKNATNLNNGVNNSDVCWSQPPVGTSDQFHSTHMLR